MNWSLLDIQNSIYSELNIADSTGIASKIFTALIKLKTFSAMKIPKSSFEDPYGITLRNKYSRLNRGGIEFLKIK